MTARMVIYKGRLGQHCRDRTKEPQEVVFFPDDPGGLEGAAYIARSHYEMEVALVGVTLEEITQKSTNLRVFLTNLKKLTLFNYLEHGDWYHKKDLFNYEEAK